MRRSHERWDLISLTWVDTGGTATALAASENYLYTVEAYEDYLAHLSDGGVLAFMRALGVRPPGRRQPGRHAPRHLRGRRGARALRRKTPGAHVLVAAVQSPFFFERGMCYVLVKKTPFARAEIDAARRFCEGGGFTLLWTPDGPADPASMPPAWRPIASVVARILEAGPDPRGSTGKPCSTSLRPRTTARSISSSAPGRTGRPARGCASSRGARRFSRPSSSCASGCRCAQVRSGRGLLTRPGVAFLATCAFLGLAFMLVEIEFFHAFGLVLGSPTWSLGTVLTVLLLFSGVGSLSASWFAAFPRRLAGAFGLLVASLGIFVLARGPILGRLVALDLPLRILGCAGVLAPIAFLMGIPMAAAMSRIGDRPQLRMWGWAVERGALRPRERRRDLPRDPRRDHGDVPRRAPRLRPRGSVPRGRPHAEVNDKLVPLRSIITAARRVAGRRPS